MLSPTALISRENGGWTLSGLVAVSSFAPPQDFPARNPLTDGLRWLKADHRHSWGQVSPKLLGEQQESLCSCLVNPQSPCGLLLGRLESPCVLSLTGGQEGNISPLGGPPFMILWHPLSSVPISSPSCSWRSRLVFPGFPRTSVHPVF